MLHGPRSRCTSVTSCVPVPEPLSSMEPNPMSATVIAPASPAFVQSMRTLELAKLPMLSVLIGVEDVALSVRFQVHPGHTPVTGGSGSHSGRHHGAGAPWPTTPLESALHVMSTSKPRRHPTDSPRISPFSSRMTSSSSQPPLGRNRLHQIHATKDPMWGIKNRRLPCQRRRNRAQSCRPPRRSRVGE